ncbi:hypothetical protein JCM10207_002239 [Rhodosporidiobolus poonsookiae]
MQAFLTTDPTRSALNTTADAAGRPHKSASSTSKGRSRKAGAGPPRPANAWICYRSARVHELKASTEYAKLPQADISKIIGQLWRSEPPEVRRRYELEAQVKKELHRQQFPDYVYRPVRRNSAKSNLMKEKKAPAELPPLDLSKPLPSVLQPLPSPLPTPTSTSTPSLEQPEVPFFDLDAVANELPTPPLSIAVPRATYAPSAAFSPEAFQLPPSPPWSSYDPTPSFAAVESVSPSQIEPFASYSLPSPPVADSFFTSPPLATDASVFDALWASATANSEFIEIPLPPSAY